MKQKSRNSESFKDRLFAKFAPNLVLHKSPETLPLNLNWRRIFVLPTKPGIFFGFVTFLMLIASLNFNNNLGLMMTFLLFGIAQVALYRTFLNLKSLTIHHVEAQPVFAGEVAIFKLHLKTTETKFDIGTKNKSYENSVLEVIPDQLSSIKHRLKSQKRGWLQCDKVKIYSSFPFGIFYAWVWVNIGEKCLVYPIPEVHSPPLPQNAGDEGDASKITHGDDFHGLKPFQSGDSLRLIAWKRTAQTGELISREFQQHQGDKLLLDYSTVPLSDMELKLARLTAWVIKAQKLQLDYCLKLPGFDSGFGYSNEHYLKCLKALALFGLENETD